MGVLIAGVDGDRGWSLAQHLRARGHEVAGVDNGARRRWVEEMGSLSAIPNASPGDRRAAFQERFDDELLVPGPSRVARAGRATTRLDDVGVCMCLTYGGQPRPPSHEPAQTTASRLRGSRNGAAVSVGVSRTPGGLHIAA